MNLSEMPKLRKARDKLAREIHRRDGGDYLRAVGQANNLIKEAMAKARASVSETLTAADLPSSARQAPDPFASLHTLDHDSASAVMKIGLASYGRTGLLRSPFWRGI